MLRFNVGLWVSVGVGVGGEVVWSSTWSGWQFVQSDHRLGGSWTEKYHRCRLMAEGICGVRSMDTLDFLTMKALFCFVLTLG